ncbi:FecR family protein [Sphingomonas abietis]|uniref:FecR domain-containing protein n=1 Tax=Sphingomonas abietis TaxID=3012344 RepID=A0ABY7NM75_9SPHN|nr:FecR domain-containing protein [Sphingomonas abietis]WBO21733.1 FecR domain-containing protein [Sphingomonas abietis]
MTDSRKSADLQALDWAILADDPTFTDWPALKAWLAADPDHPVLFDRATIAVEEAASAVSAAPRERLTLVADNPEPLVRRQDRASPRWWPAGIAASLVAAVGLTVWLGQGTHTPAMQEIATRPGEVRVVVLDGVTVTLNGDSALRAPAGSPREVVLARGEASFDVVHDAERPFAVRVGDAVVRDIGTRFDVLRDEQGITVAVAEGSVEVASGGAKVPVRAGERTVVAANEAPSAPQAVAPSTVTGWQTGQLIYDDATLDRIIADVRRRTGLAIRLAPALEHRRFAGSLNVAGPPETVIARLEEVLAVSAQKDGAGWLLVSRQGGRR